MRVQYQYTNQFFRRFISPITYVQSDTTSLFQLLFLQLNFTFRPVYNGGTGNNAYKVIKSTYICDISTYFKNFISLLKIYIYEAWPYLPPGDLGVNTVTVSLCEQDITVAVLFTFFFAPAQSQFQV